MLYRVFRMYERGEALPLEVVRQGGRVGKLLYGRRIEWVPKCWARLLSPEFTYVFPVLEPAEIFVLDHWVEIHGTEHTNLKGTYKNVKSTRWPQVWRCLPVLAAQIIKLPVVEIVSR